MKWSYWIELYIRTHCVARGLRPLTIAAYEDILEQFRQWVRIKLHDCEPDQVTARDVLAYVQYLREVRDNGDSAINRTVVVLRQRDSLACDLMEVVRPQVDAWLLGWLQRELFARSWFFETREGNCRLKGPFAAKLSETASTWRKFVAPWAEFIARELWTTTRKRTPAQQSPPTRLTQRRRSEGRGKEFIPDAVPLPKPERVCRSCGAPAPHGERCANCGREFAREKMIAVAKVGRALAHEPAARQKCSETQRRHEAAEREWERSGESSISEELYRTQVQPKLKSVTLPAIMDALKVSVVYASHIRRGQVPHRRHWESLAGLVGTPVIS